MLLSGIKALAYAKQDADTFNAAKAASFEAEFKRYAFEAARDKEKREHKPRAVRYGGIPM
jgi:hypothetical protein